MTVLEPRETETPVELITLTIDGVEVSVPKGTLVIRAAELMGVEIPRFCDHPLLEPVGACRQCLVEVPDAGNGRGFPKPQASCTLEAAPGMVVETHVTNAVAEKAQKGNLEFLLINHPLDCPVCDKGGECPLQNQSLSHGTAESRYIENKRTFAKPIEVSAQILLDRERCVMCQRCTRFSAEIAGDPFIELLERGAQQQIGIAEEKPFHSYFSGNTIQICPVGALTSADYRFRSRPFDLVSVPSIAEHDACGAAIRVDHRRGKVLRRLAGDDPEVNEEWISDKDRFAFTWARREDRLTRPLVRDPETGELEPTSWPAALAVAAAGLKAAGASTGILTGGRLTLEDAYAYSKFARTVLGTNSIDFRARAVSAEETAFLAHAVAGSTTGNTLTYADFERASRVVLVGLEPEDEAATIFLRLRKAVRHHGVEVVSVASHLTWGAEKLGARLVSTVPGAEAAAIADLEVDSRTIILAGERLVGAPGALSAVLAARDDRGAAIAWVPRRAGDRGALDAGCLPGLLPGGRPVASSEARADLSAAWGGAAINATEGLDTDAMIEAAASGSLSALIVAGVDPLDLPDHARALEALDRAFVVSLEVRESEATARADVVLPVVAPVEKAGSFVTWDSRVRSFEQILAVPGGITDIRALEGIAQELGTSLGFRNAEGALAQWHEVDVWDGDRAPFTPASASTSASVSGVALSTWHQQIDDGRGQDGQPTYRSTARPAVLRASAATLAKAGVEPGAMAIVTGPAGSARFTTDVADLPEGTVWVPANSAGVHVRSTTGAGHGDRVQLKGGVA